MLIGANPSSEIVNEHGSTIRDAQTRRNARLFENDYNAESMRQAHANRRGSLDSPLKDELRQSVHGFPTHYEIHPPPEGFEPRNLLPGFAYISRNFKSTHPLPDVVFKRPDDLYSFPDILPEHDRNRRYGSRTPPPSYPTTNDRSGEHLPGAFIGGALGGTSGFVGTSAATVFGFISSLNGGRVILPLIVLGVGMTSIVTVPILTGFAGATIGDKAGRAISNSISDLRRSNVVASRSSEGKLSNDDVNDRQEVAVVDLDQAGRNIRNDGLTARYLSRTRNAIRSVEKNARAMVSSASDLAQSSETSRRQLMERLRLLPSVPTHSPAAISSEKENTSLLSKMDYDEKQDEDQLLLAS